MSALIRSATFRIVGVRGCRLSLRHHKIQEPISKHRVQLRDAGQRGDVEERAVCSQRTMRQQLFNDQLMLR